MRELIDPLQAEMEAYLHEVKMAVAHAM